MKDKLVYELLATAPLKAILGVISMLTRRGKGFVNMIDNLSKFNIEHPLSDPSNLIWSWHAYGSKEWACEYFKITEQEIIEGRYDLIKRFRNRPIYDVWSLCSLLGDEDLTLSIWTRIGEGDGKVLYSPFYDRRVLDYVFSIPWELKLKRPENILRKVIARKCEVPEFILHRPKSGFGVRTKQWSQEGGVFEPLVPLASKVFDEKQIRRMQSSDPKRSMTFWNILNYAIWKRLHIANESLDLLREELEESISRRKD
jgi:hypothetical protein